MAVCLSKGLGAPVGSLLAGSCAVIEKARRFRRMYGGSMRQAGVLAAAGVYALKHHYQRLADDHRNAALMAAMLAEQPGVSVVTPDTNIVLFDLLDGLPDAEALTSKLAKVGVLCAPFGPRRVRLVTHLDVSEQLCAEAAQRIRQVICAS